MKRRSAAGWLLLVLATASAGCDEHAGAPPVSGSLEEVTVKGTVRVRDKPVTNGMVHFRASNIRRPNVGTRSAEINKDGTYTIKTFVGENYVSVDCKELMTPKNRQFVDNEALSIVEPGGGTLDLDVPQKPKPAETIKIEK